LKNVGFDLILLVDHITVGGEKMTAQETVLFSLAVFGAAFAVIAIVRKVAGDKALWPACLVVFPTSASLLAVPLILSFNSQTFGVREVLFLAFCFFGVLSAFGMKATVTYYSREGGSLIFSGTKSGDVMRFAAIATAILAALVAGLLIYEAIFKEPSAITAWLQAATHLTYAVFMYTFAAPAQIRERGFIYSGMYYSWDKFNSFDWSPNRKQSETEILRLYLEKPSRNYDRFMVIVPVGNRDRITGFLQQRISSSPA
jgi:uncharacterized membrane protein YobD (UPF0266 family)